MYAGLGFAVVASDYAGLGTHFPHAPFDMRSNALDVLYSIPAARAALPQLGGQWLVAGHAYGGLVAVGVAESASGLAGANFLGALAISGLGDSREIFLRMAQNPSNSNLVFLAKGIGAVFPEFRVSDMLTPGALPIYEYIGHACEPVSDSPHGAIPLLQPGWENNRHVQEFLARNTPGQKAAGVPFLIISGDADPEVPTAITATAVARLCGQKNRVVFVNYSGLNSGEILRNSVGEQVSWIRSRFAGSSAPSNCH
jgi:pimeloyl-ACP methyl ester carboxylesterase